MADPTNARTRPLQRFFAAPRTAIKALPASDDHPHDDRDRDGSGREPSERSARLRPSR